MTSEAERVEEVACTLTRGQREMMKGRHTDDGNPWPFISITQRTGGAKHRMFQPLIAAGLYDRGNNLTARGRTLRAHLLAKEVRK